MTRETVSPGGGSQAARAARRDEAALLGEVLADAFAKDPVFAWAPSRSYHTGSPAPIWIRSLTRWPTWST